MEKHFLLTDEDFEKQFINASLDPEIFSHEAHLRLAWLHIHNYGIDKAIQNITTQLRAYVLKLGAIDKYNHTLTIAAIKAVYHFYNKTYADNFQEFISKNQRLKSSFKELMNAHYSTNIFISDAAKTKYLEPELLPFD